MKESYYDDGVGDVNSCYNSYGEMGGTRRKKALSKTTGPFF